MPRVSSSLLLSLAVASSASAVTMDWTFIGYPGNPADTEVMAITGSTGKGSVPYDYRIGTYEVTNAQYAEFLNAKAAFDYWFFYDPAMGTHPLGGIAQSGSSGSYTYTAIAGRENLPVNFVTFYDILRFTNWMNNGQGNGDTETGAYTLVGGTDHPNIGPRNAGAMIFLPTENEWYKAAYYDPSTTSYFDYPTASDTPPTCTTPTATPNSANCGSPFSLTPVGSYTGSASPYGTFDQDGNVTEWVETIIYGEYRGIRDGAASADYFLRPSAFASFGGIGFRLAMVPEPGTGLLVSVGLLGLGIRRRVRA